MIQSGNGLALSIIFANGDISSRRPLLVISVDKALNEIKALNVSGLSGKEARLARSSNIEIYDYNPPFDFPSFVKLDVVYIISYFPELDRQLCKGGTCLKRKELQRILGEFESFCKNHKPIVVKIDEITLKRINHILR